MDTKSQNSNMLLAFLTLTGVIAIVAVIGFFMLRKGPEIVQGQAEVTEYRVSSKVPGLSLYFFDDFLCWSWVYACIMSNK